MRIVVFPQLFEWCWCAGALRAQSTKNALLAWRGGSCAIIPLCRGADAACRGTVYKHRAATTNCMCVARIAGCARLWCALISFSKYIKTVLIKLTHSTHNPMELIQAIFASNACAIAARIVCVFFVFAFFFFFSHL